MTAEDLKTVLHKNPFRPFSVQMTSGDTYTFTKPEDGAIDKKGRSLFFFSDDGLVAWLDTSLIESITSP